LIGQLFFYADVLNHTEKITERKNQSFFYRDLIVVRETALKDEKLKEILTKADLERLNRLLEETKLAFDEGKYSDVERLLTQIQEEIETKRSELATLAVLRKGARNFFQRYWVEILIFLFISGIVGFFLYKRTRTVLLKRKVRKLKAEKQAILGLIKETQIKRFKQNKISELVYNLRMKKFKEKLKGIKTDLPVLEAELLQRQAIQKKIKQKISKEPEKTKKPYF